VPDYLSAYLVRVISFLVCIPLLPLTAISFFILSRRRHVARVNTDLCFPTMPFLQRRVLLFRIFFNFFYAIWESFLAWGLPSAVLEKMIENKSEADISHELHKNEPCLLICPHYSCLEMVAPALSLNLSNLVMSYRPHENKRVERIMVGGRSRFGRLIIVKEVRLMIKELKGSAKLWFGPDQDKGLVGSVFSTFFNVPASTVTTPARLARVTGVPVYFVGFRRKFFKYELAVKKFPSGYPYDDEVANADILNQFIEASLSHDRSQYMWFHRRFKTQPNSPRYSLYQ
jgi:Kdo2-lipid IVA lauroyltransferase/acyltransferase